MQRALCFSILLIASIPGVWAQGTSSAVVSPSASASVERLMARPAWATAERPRGGVDAKSSITIKVHVPLRDLVGAKAELEAVSDPASPRYGQYLTSEEFESKYSPTVEDTAAVQSYLLSEGFSITYAPRNRFFVSATAKASDVERVFATHLGQYEVEEGQLLRAPIEA